MSKTELYDRLVAIRSEALTSFYVPGHKNGNLLSGYFPGNIGSYDITEFPGADNLHYPEAAIKAAQERAVSLYGTQKSYFLVNGTTCGIIAMIMGSTSPGDKVIVVRDCHQSVLNAIKLGHLNPIYIMPYIDEETGLSYGVTPESLEDTLDKHSDAKAVILTYPTYHGVCTDIKAIEKIIHDRDKLMLVDEAHGAHLLLSEDLPMSSIEAGADVVVHSTHKSLPALTQSSMLHLNSARVSKNQIETMLRMHQSSSPSYLLMASLDIAMSIVEDDGENLMKALLANVAQLKASAKENDLVFLESDYLSQKGRFELDPTKLTLLGKASAIDTVELEIDLRSKCGIQCEYTNSNMALFITSIGTSRSDLDKLLIGILLVAKLRNEDHDKVAVVNTYVPKVVFKPSDAMYMDKNKVKIDDSLGCICGDSVIPYPPGIPLIIPGEEIDAVVIEYIKNGDQNGVNITGLDNHHSINIIDRKE